MNLLTDRIFSVDHGQDLSLPEILSWLSNEDALEFTGLRPHQQHAWFAFLTQLASLALAKAGEETDGYSALHWEEMLSKLTEGKTDPWELVVTDLSQPAFMQPPVPEGTIESWNRFSFPDEIDVLITTKNHDLKRAKIVAPRPEHWVFSLITRQTMQGVYGRGHYGIARMNSGLGSRPLFTLAPSEYWSDRFLRDVDLWLDQRVALRERYDANHGIALLWTVPWDGKKSLELKQLDPCFIEVCARMRMMSLSEIRGTTSVTWRVASKEAKGNTGDLWTPINAETQAAVSVTGRGFSFESLQEIWFSKDWIRPPAMQHMQGDEILIARVLSRGQGKTEGFHQRVVPIVNGETAEQRVEVAKNFKLRVVKPAILNLIQSGPDSLRFDDSRVERWLERFRDEIDRVFFEMPDPWETVVFEISQKLFGQAVDNLAPSGARRYRAIVWAERCFYGAIKHHFPAVVLPSMRKQKDEATNRRHARIMMIAASMHHQTSPKDLAALQQLRSLESKEFELLMKRFVQPPEPGDEPWVVIFRSMAKMSGLHRSGFTIGRVLATLRFDEQRTMALLSSSGEDFYRRIDMLVRYLTTRGVPVDQTEFADLVLSHGQQWADPVRRKIAQDFYGGQS